MYASHCALSGLLLLTAAAVGGEAASTERPARAPEGTVVTHGERLEGRILLREDAIGVARNEGGREETRAVDWGDVLYLFLDEPLQRARGPEELQLRGGEVWQVDIQGIEEGKVAVRSPLFGSRKVDLESVACLDFFPPTRARSTAPRDPDRGWLYRREGEATPGALLWMDRERLTVNSPLGVLTLQRKDLARYVFPIGKAGRSTSRDAARLDEVFLADGTLLRGSLLVEEERLRLEHPALGELVFPRFALRSVVRGNPALLDLTGVEPLAVETQPLIAGPVTDKGLRVLSSAADAAPGDFPFARALRIEPETVVRYRVPGVESGRARLRACIGRAGGSRGDLRLEIRAGDRMLLERSLPPESRPEWVALDLPPGEDLAFEVRFGRRIRFPCAVLLGEPHVLKGVEEAVK